MEEPLIFEQDAPGRSGVDLPEPPPVASRLNGLERHGTIGMPGLSEPQVIRHFTRLSQKNYAIDSGLYPLGSCTMKHNPRLNEKLARLPGFADLHPLQPESTVQGALELIDTLAHWLKVLTGMPAMALSPAAGAHGELCGIMAIRAALEARGDARGRILVPESAHGTNPATAAACGYSVEAIPANKSGRVDLDALKEKLAPDVAALMLTNPNTCGLLENEIIEIGRRSMMRARSSTVTAPISTRSSGGCGRPISASTRCTSTCTRPFRRPMAVAVPAAAPLRWPRSWRPLRRCRGRFMVRTASS